VILLFTEKGYFKLLYCVVLTGNQSVFCLSTVLLRLCLVSGACVASRGEKCREGAAMNF